MITLFGAPGAGKTVQGQLLARRFGWTWFSYRDLLESINDRDIKMGLEHGTFIDDDKAIPLMQGVFNQLHGKKQVILDGFPADYRQVRWMIETGEIRNLQGAIVLRVPHGERWKRLVERKRVDDTRAAIERRQDAYDRSITGMIKALSANGVEIAEVDGCNAPEDVLARIEEVLGSWGLVAKKQFQDTPTRNRYSIK